MTDIIYNDTYQGTYNGKEGVEFTTPVNGGGASWIGGLELGINRRFDFLPGFLKYFGTQLNATFMDSEMTKASGRKVGMAYQAGSLFNAQLFFEKGGFNTRLAFNHKGKYAIAYGERDIDDVYYGKYNTLDFSASYQIGKKWTIYTDFNNILNNPLIYHYGKSQDRPKQVEYYGVKGNIGVKFTL
ncbi:TonB-dependent receptor [Tenacibaculum pacificus]|nr:TonB-dependent receptor [Tenacibaculum pacificus]WBX74810.1 TonB-dependent receptor [Tenacibaculum pacificus]